MSKSITVKSVRPSGVFVCVVIEVDGRPESFLLNADEVSMETITEKWNALRTQRRNAEDAADRMCRELGLNGEDATL